MPTYKIISPRGVEIAKKVNSLQQSVEDKKVEMNKKFQDEWNDFIAQVDTQSHQLFEELKQEMGISMKITEPRIDCTYLDHDIAFFTFGSEKPAESKLILPNTGLIQ